MLERQKIVVPLAQGVDTKTDEKQVEAGKLLELENGVFTTLKSIRKRDGNVAQPAFMADATDRAAGQPFVELRFRLGEQFDQPRCIQPVAR
jgi:hypothetical protein